MLGSALNQHSQVNVLDEPGRGIGMFPDDWESSKPMWVQIHTYPVWDRNFKGKVIRLQRSLEGLIQAHHRMSKGLWFPNRTKIKVPPLMDRERNEYSEYLSPRMLEMDNWCEDKETLYLSYESLTNDKHITEISNSQIICNFLGVDVERLKPMTCKAEVQIDVDL